MPPSAKTSDPTQRVSLAEKVDFLSQPTSYPEKPQTVLARETHMSWVFLTDTMAYKLKKPTLRPFLDFRSLGARHANCAEEVRLNRRLAPEVYLSVTPLTLEMCGRLCIGGEGQVVDWLVVMRRLSEKRMLDEMLKEKTANRQGVEEAARVLAGFYKTAPAIRIPASEYRRRFRHTIEKNLEVLLCQSCSIADQRAITLCTRQLDFLEQRSELFDQRIASGHYVEGHGDLRPEHVCLEHPIEIIDCLEFDRKLRLQDPADELAFLAMECEMLGADWVSNVLFETYASVTGDQPCDALLHFYKSFRACIRARLALWHLLDDEVSEPEKWHGQARGYVELAERHASAFS